MPQGILRNRFHEFLKAKGKKSITKKRYIQAENNLDFLKHSQTNHVVYYLSFFPDDDQEIIRSTLLTYSTKASEVEMSEIQEPSWIQDYKNCCFILKEVDICRQQIKKENAKKLKSARQQVHQKRIRLLADEATQKLRNCQKKLKNIELSNSMNPNVHERKLFTNIIVSLAQKIRSTTRALRNDRQEELSHERQLRQFSRSNFDEEIKFLSQNREEQWLSEQGFQKLQQRLMNERNQQLMKIVKSIHSLNSIYKELQDLVIHQGSLLDRIDQNIQTTYQKVQEANQHLHQAQQHQKNSFAKKIIYVMLFIIFILFVIFMIKHK